MCPGSGTRSPNGSDREVKLKPKGIGRTVIEEQPGEPCTDQCAWYRQEDCLSIDDFGTGYSSLAYLRRFPVDKLKIDMAFIRGITTNADDAAIVLAITRMAHTLKLEVIAEGVETAAQLEYLRSHRCDQIQGYCLSRPLPVAELERLFRETDRKLSVENERNEFDWATSTRSMG